MEISLVRFCPYCGSGDWDAPKPKSDGAVCNHPTKLTVSKPDGADLPLVSGDPRG